MTVQRALGARTNPYFMVLTAFAFAASSSVSAADPPPSTSKDCTKIESYRGMVDCYAENARDAEAVMTRVYEGVLKKMGASVQHDLLNSSQAA